MEIQNFRILALMIYNIASAVKVSDHTPTRFSSHFFTFHFSAQVIPHHPGASAIDIWAKCISEGQLQESFSISCFAILVSKEQQNTNRISV